MLRKSIATVAILLFALTGAVLAQNEEPGPCDDPAFRDQVTAMVDSGASEDEVAAFVSDSCDGVVFQPTSKGLTVTNNGSVFFEQMNACGYHPQAEMVSCDVQLKQVFGFGFFPSGSTEHVRFCFDCNQDGVFEYQTNGFVHVTDDISGQAPPWQFQAHATTFNAPAGCTANNGGVTNARAILSWQIPPQNIFGFQNCAVPAGRFFWGNTVDFMIRRDP